MHIPQENTFFLFQEVHTKFDSMDEVDDPLELVLFFYHSFFYGDSYHSIQTVWIFFFRYNISDTNNEDFLRPLIHKKKFEVILIYLEVFLLPENSNATEWTFYEKI